MSRANARGNALFLGTNNDLIADFFLQKSKIQQRRVPRLPHASYGAVLVMAVSDVLVLNHVTDKTYSPIQQRYKLVETHQYRPQSTNRQEEYKTQQCRQRR